MKDYDIVGVHPSESMDLMVRRPDVRRVSPDDVMTPKDVIAEGRRKIAEDLERFAQEQAALDSQMWLAPWTVEPRSHARIQQGFGHFDEIARRMKQSP